LSAGKGFCNMNCRLLGSCVFSAMLLGVLRLYLVAAVSAPCTKSSLRRQLPLADHQMAPGAMPLLLLLEMAF
jgi:hypothetical protein